MFCRQPTKYNLFNALLTSGAVNENRPNPVARVGRKSKLGILKLTALQLH